MELGLLTDDNLHYRALCLRMPSCLAFPAQSPGPLVERVQVWILPPEVASLSPPELLVSHTSLCDLCAVLLPAALFVDHLGPSG